MYAPVQFNGSSNQLELTDLNSCTMIRCLRHPSLEPRLYKTVPTLSPEDKERICKLVQHDRQSMFMAAMAIHCHQVHLSRFVKCCQGAGCLVYDYARSVYLIQVYSLSRKKMLWEEEMNFDRIRLHRYESRLLSIVDVHNRTIMVEFVKAVQMYSMFTILDDLQNKLCPKAQPVIRRSVSESFFTQKNAEHDANAGTRPDTLNHGKVYLDHGKTHSVSFDNLRLIQITSDKPLMEGSTAEVSKSEQYPAATVRSSKNHSLNSNRHTFVVGDTMHIPICNYTELQEAISKHRSRAKEAKED